MSDSSFDLLCKWLGLALLLTVGLMAGIWVWSTFVDGTPTSTLIANLPGAFLVSFVMNTGLCLLCWNDDRKKPRNSGSVTGVIGDGYPEDWGGIKHHVLVRDGYRCANFGGTSEMHVHHIVPLSKGGTNQMTNRTSLCKECHERVHPHMKYQVRDFN